MKRLVDIVSGLGVKDPSLKRQTVYRPIEEKWLDIFGQLAHTLRFSHVKNKVLVISSTNPTWINEISYYEAEFLKKINQVLADKRYHIRSLKVIIQAKSVASRFKTKSEPKKKSGRTLEENIKFKMKERQKLGYKPCTKCGIVLSLQPVCRFCKAK